MTNPYTSAPLDSHAQLRRWAYALMIIVSVSQVAGRIGNVQRVYEPGIGRWPATQPTPWPTIGGNDRSRWCTVRALVDEGTYAIGERVEFPFLGEMSAMEVHGVVLGRWLNQGAIMTVGGQGPIPPPPPPYVDRGITTQEGWETLDKVLNPRTKQFYSSKPPLLPTLLAGEYWLLKQVFGWEIASEPWPVVRTILFTVNVVPWLIFLILLAALVEKLATSDWTRLFVVAAAAFGTMLTPFLIVLNNHTVAACAALAALYFAVTIWFDGRHEWWRFALAGMFAAFTACNELPAAFFGLLLFGLMLATNARNTLLGLVPGAMIPIAAFLGANYLAIGELLPAYEKFGTIWYNYPGSYWNARRGIDAANDPMGVYAFHLLLGHHGILSLSPLYALSVVGMLANWWFDRTRRRTLTLIGLVTLILTLVLLAFYVVYAYEVLQTRNYGGMTSGPRWFFWLIPFWLLTLIPVADQLADSGKGRCLGYLLLGLSVISVSYPAWNPWRHPWLHNLLEYLKVIQY